MCGIIGYVGKEKNIKTAIEDLKKLEYRGYDSAGIAWHDLEKKRILFFKKEGKVKNLEKEFLKEKKSFYSDFFIAHTRWATHGKPSDINAHPHFDCKKNIFVVHNGIIENHKELKEALIKEGHKFRSETDTETIAHLIEKYFESKLEEAVRKALKFIKGAYGLAVISSLNPQKIVIAKNFSPLLIGAGKEGNFISSDPSSLLNHTKKVFYLEDGEMAVVFPGKFRIFNLKNEERFRKPVFLDWDLKKIQKKGYSHFMLKEIMEQPEALENSLRGRVDLKEGSAKLGGLERIEKKLKETKNIYIVGCGSAYYAALAGEYMIEEYAKVPVEVELASEFRYRHPLLDKNSLLLAISQSGETADTLAAVQEAKKLGALTLGIVNVVGSSIAREVEAGIYNHAGPEISVASTKAFTSQLTVLVLLTLFLARQREMSFVFGKKICCELLKIPFLAKKTLKLATQIKKLAKKYKKYKNFLYLGRKYNYPAVLEGALKLKEIAYLHAEAYAGGEMKHGPLALIDENFPVVALCPKDSVYKKMISNLEEIKSRKGKIILLTNKSEKRIEKMADDILFLPKTLEILNPIFFVIPLQLFAYYLGLFLKREIDKPRNLAKSVTVE